MGDFEIKIRKINDPDLKQIAIEADKDGNKKLKGDEISIFQDKVKESDVLKNENTLQEFNSIMGLEKSEPQKKSPAKAEDKFLQRREELAEVTAKELDKTKVNTYDKGAWTNKHNTNYALFNSFTLSDVLKYDYLNEDLATDKDGVLTAQLKAKYPDKGDKEIADMVKIEMEKRQGRFTKNADGTFGEPYNLQELADLLPPALGADYTLNQSKNIQVYEGTPTADDFVAKIFPNGIEEFYVEQNISPKGKDRATDDLTKNLVKFLGGNIQGNQHKIIDAFKKGAGAGIPAAVGTGLVPWFIQENNIVVNVTEQQLQHVGAATTEEALLAIMNQTAGMTEEEAAAFLNEQLGGLIQYQSNNVSVPIDSRLINSLANIAVSLGAAIAMAILKDLIFGEAREFEKAVVGLHPLDVANNAKEMEDVDAFKEYVDGHDRQFPKGTKSLMKALADKFTYEDECGNKKFSYLHMYGFLGQIAGKDSNLNATELLEAMETKYGQKCLQSWIDKMNKEKACCPDAKPVEEEPAAPEEPVAPEEPEEPKGPIFGKLKIEKVDVLGDNVKVAGWGQMKDAYKDCFDNYFKNGGVLLKGSRDYTERRVMKLIQGITDNNFSEARITQLLTLVKQGKLTKAYVENPANKMGWFDWDKYNKALAGAAGRDAIIPQFILYSEDKSMFELTADDKLANCTRGGLGKITWEYETDENIKYANRGDNTTYLGADNEKDAYQQLKGGKKEYDVKAAMEIDDGKGHKVKRYRQEN